MKTIKIMILMAALTLAWGCSSSSDNSGDTPQPQPGPGPVPENTVFTPCDGTPTWAIDWTWLNDTPTWEEPDPSYSWLNMQIQMVLDDALAAYSTDDDMVAVFMNGTCRGVGKRNVHQDGRVIFLVSIEGEESEIGNSMEMSYFNAQLKHLFVNKNLPPFEPSNLWGDQYHLVQEIGMGSSKYPFSTKLFVELPCCDLPFKLCKEDAVFVFIDGECRGVFNVRNGNTYSGYVFSLTEGETAEIRFYSEDMKGYYTFKQTVTLNNSEQHVNVKF